MNGATYPYRMNRTAGDSAEHPLPRSDSPAPTLPAESTPCPGNIVPRSLIPLEVARMRAHPTFPVRPLVLLAGWRAPSIAVWNLGRRLGLLTGMPRSRILAIGYPLRSNIDSIAEDVARQIGERFPARSGHGSEELDVVGVSMGGLVARLAASPALARRTGVRLRMRRLFTLATPHRGARITSLYRLDGAARAMTPGSTFLQRLDDALACSDYELICYTRLHDTWVGARNTAPADTDPIWLPGFSLGAHVAISHDPRVTLDIARRLRNEPPLLGHIGPPPSN